MGPLDYTINLDGTIMVYDPDTGKNWLAVDPAVTIDNLPAPVDTEASILRSQLEHQKDQNRALQDEIERLNRKINHDYEKFGIVEQALLVVRRVWGPNGSMGVVVNQGIEAARKGMIQVD